MKKFLLLVVSSVFVLGACGEKPKKALTRAELRLIDSLYRKEIDSLREGVEKWCDDNRERLYNRAVDSIPQLRVSEIEKLRREE